MRLRLVKAIAATWRRDGPMIGSARPDVRSHVNARTLPAIFSNYTRCPECRGTGEIRVHYDPGCPTIVGPHFHRECPCGATWPERSAGHVTSDIQLGNPRWVPLCQHCEARHTDMSCMHPRCCRLAEISYHDTLDPCDACSRYTT
jgi:hypothetical protein